MRTLQNAHRFALAVAVVLIAGLVLTAAVSRPQRQRHTTARCTRPTSPTSPATARSAACAWCRSTRRRPRSTPRIHLPASPERRVGQARQVPGVRHGSRPGQQGGPARGHRGRGRAQGPLLPQPDGPDGHLAGAGEGRDGHGLRAGLRRRGDRAGAGRCRAWRRSTSEPRGSGWRACRPRRPSASGSRGRSAPSAPSRPTRRASATSTPRSPAGSRSSTSTSPASSSGRASRSSPSTRRSCWRARRSSCGRETAAARFAASELPEVRKGGEDLLAAARRRLELFDVPEEFIAELERTGKPQRTVTLVAPVSGFVTVEGHRSRGSRSSRRMELFTITDLSQVWIEADFYEYEARARAPRRRQARLTLPYDPAARARPAGSPTSTRRSIPRPARSRCASSSPTPACALKPGMFANVELEVDGAPGRRHPRLRRHRHGRAAGRLRRAGRRAVRAARGRGRRPRRRARRRSSRASRRASRSSSGRTSCSTPSRASRAVAIAGLPPARPPEARREASHDRADHRVLRAATGCSCCSAWRRSACCAVVHARGRSASTRCPTSPTPRSSSTRAGTAARTSSRTRSPTRSSPRCSARRKVKAIRGFSDFGFSYVYVIFQDGTDLYWARSRVLEYLSKIQPRLPAGRADRARARRDRRRLGLPVRAGRPDGHARARRAALLPGLDLRYALQAVPGVAEVAAIGGFVKQYQVTVDPEPPRRLRRPARPGRRRRSGRATTRWAGGCSSSRGREYMVRGRGYVRVARGPRADRRQGRRRAARRSCCATSPASSSAPRSAAASPTSTAWATRVGGIVVMRHGENALNVIDRGQGEARGARAVAARRASRSSPPTTAPTSSSAPSTRSSTS